MRADILILNLLNITFLWCLNTMTLLYGLLHHYKLSTSGSVVVCFTHSPNK